MSRLGMSPGEYNYVLDNIREAFDLIGQEAILSEVDHEVKDLYRDPATTYKDEKLIGLIFEDNPRPILKKMNWLIEDEELPYVVHIVALATNREPVVVTENMKITIPSVYGVNTVRTFIVTRVTGNSIDPLTWICKLVPYREKIDMIPETPGVIDHEKVSNPSDVGINYLNI